MLDYNSASALYHDISTKAADSADSEFLAFYDEVLRSAVEYAAARTNWHFLDAAQRMEKDAGRSRKHDGYMAGLSAVCRYLHVENIDTLLPDRKTKGDFACYIALFLALEQR